MASCPGSPAPFRPLVGEGCVGLSECRTLPWGSWEGGSSPSLGTPAPQTLGGGPQSQAVGKLERCPGPGDARLGDNPRRVKQASGTHGAQLDCIRLSCWAGRPGCCCPHPLRSFLNGPEHWVQLCLPCPPSCGNFSWRAAAIYVVRPWFEYHEPRRGSSGCDWTPSAWPAGATPQGPPHQGLIRPLLGLCVRELGQAGRSLWG